MGMHTESWHRRQAVALAAALPDDPEDAEIVLQLALELLETFIRKGYLAGGECNRASRPLPGDA
jgi:hypothetical protein